MKANESKLAQLERCFKKRVQPDVKDETESSDSDSEGSFTPRRKKYPPDIKIMIAELAKANYSRLVSERFGIHVGLVRKWLTKYNKSGSQSFYPHGKITIKQEPTEEEYPILEATDSLYIHLGEEMPSQLPSSDFKVRGDGHVQTKSETGGTIVLWEYNSDNDANLRLLAAQDGRKSGYKKVAKLIGVERASVKRWMKMLNVMGKKAPIFNHDIIGSQGKSQYSADLRREVAELAQKQGITQVCQKYGIPGNTVRDWKSKYINLEKTSFFHDDPLYPDPILIQDKRVKKQVFEGTRENMKVEVPECKKEGGEDNNIYIHIEGVNQTQTHKTRVIPPPAFQQREVMELTTRHITLDRSNSKLPAVAGFEKVTLISPTLRLWAAKEGIKNGVIQTALLIGVNRSTVQRWVAAYKSMGEEAHIFKTTVKYYSGEENKGSRNGITKFTAEFKNKVCTRAMKESANKVAFQYGISPDTITKWKKKLNFPKVDYFYELPQQLTIAK